MEWRGSAGACRAGTGVGGHSNGKQNGTWFGLNTKVQEIERQTCQGGCFPPLEAEGPIAGNSLSAWNVFPHLPPRFSVTHHSGSYSTASPGVFLNLLIHKA